MTWAMVGLIFLAWCLVSVVAGLLFGPLLGGTSSVRRRRDAAAPLQLPRGREETRPADMKGAGATYRPLAIGGAPDPPLEDG